ncbi:hypothetical protein A3765_28480 [Oleiphilus sp. HI0130]|nr:hypothetical protein A3765_28805 [Oleiphilus sp. HI0130]KZZ72489.1 hypothetical protein A3765_28480 [Oleiphilus sp. HI0130]
MKNPSFECIEALAALEHNRDFKIIKQWIEEGLHDATSRAVDQDNDVAIRLAQGEARSLNAMLSHMNSAREYIKLNRRD